MPGRGGRQYSQQGDPKSSASNPRTRTKKTAKRALNAFSIAQHSVPEGKIRRGRLGELDGEAGGGNKRRRNGDDDSDGEDYEDDEEDERQGKKPRRGGKDKFGNEIDGGSDSEGNEWITGAVASDESDIDSDDAMGESDEDKFEGFTFGGSQKKSRRRKRNAADSGGLDLDEDDDRSLSEGEESDGFAAEAVDLADVLDMSGDSEEESQGSQDESGHEEDEELMISDVDEDANDPKKLSALQDLLSSMDNGDGKKHGRSELDLAQEAITPSEYGLNPKQKLSVADLLATVTDPTLRKSLKILADDGKKSKTSGIPGKLSAPLPKRQQDRIDRAAAFEKSKETLSRWIETVKLNRRAEHLVFPLVDQDIESAKNTKRLLPASKPANELEATIQKILTDSGLGERGEAQDGEMQRFEELATNKLPIEEVRARQAELRRARDLLFREEIRAKRIKKIKSKAYRRVHRKERERNALREHDALAEAGFVPSEDEQEKADRKRAEERMGQRHRESRWAKSIKETGRAAWDDEARDGVTAMLRQDEELKRRIHGKDVQESESESNSEPSDEDEEAFTQRMQDKLTKLSTTESKPESKLSSMKFMQKAEAARRSQNEEAAEQLRRELDGASSDDSEGSNTGRRKFGPQRKVTTALQPKIQKQEFEEGHESDENRQNDDVEIVVDDANKDTTSTRAQSGKSRPLAMASRSTKTNGILDDEEANPFLTVKRKSKKNASEPEVLISSAAQLSTKPNKMETKQAPQIPAVSKTTTKARASSNDDNNNDNDSFTGFSPSPSPPPTSKPASSLTRHELISAAFAADDDLVNTSFAAEKAALANSEDAIPATSTGLPGWGSWTGPGLSKKEKAHARATLSSASSKNSNSNNVIKLDPSDGVAPSARKDKALSKVIISEKRMPKTAKYLATSLPFPFESQSQYERSLRLPMGPEFTTKTAHQGMVKPRVLIKGGVVRPLRKPLV